VVGGGGRSDRGAVSVDVLIVDGHQLFADALALRLESGPAFTTATATSVEAALEQVERRRPDVLVVALDLGGRRVGEEAIRSLRGRHPELPVVAVAPAATAEAGVRAVRAGAVGFVSMADSAEQLVAVVRGVSRGEAHLPPRLLADVLRALQAPEQRPTKWEVRVSRLTSRELEVLTLMVAGRRPAAIAEELFLSVNTVRTHLKKVLAKLEVHSSVEAVSVALKAGIRGEGVEPRPLGQPTARG
jgi:DNA-binding NarL/FixJ family response regulator